MTTMLAAMSLRRGLEESLVRAPALKMVRISMLTGHTAIQLSTAIFQRRRRLASALIIDRAPINF
jgi:hypothetical protein